MNNNNNIFSYATSELSQDAFLCWLFSYALKDAEDEPAIKNCAVDFLKQFIPEIKNESNIWLSNKPEKQYKFIDILLTVNDKYKVIIEDKTYTKEHNDQLNVYYDTIKKEFKDYEVKGVYFKTGFQSDKSNIDKHGYMYFGLKTILMTIEKYVSDTSNTIFLSYYYYLKNFDMEIKKYLTLPICQWSWEQINGFYDSVKNDENVLQGMTCDYGYVPNQSGGFYGMWLYNNSIYSFDGNNYELYLQCEFSDGNLRICYKASSQSGNKINKKTREYFVWREEDRWIDIADKNGFKKPSRYGYGKTVTLGIYFNYMEFDLNNIYYNGIKKLLSDAIKAFKKTVNELMSN